LQTPESSAGLKLVAIGGGTGLSTLLRGLKKYVDGEGAWSISGLGAIVTVTDEGGSSGAGAAIANAVADALAPLGVAISELPLSPDRLARLVRERGARA